MSGMEAPRASDLIREPSTEAFADFARMYDEKTGKFVRIGSIILVAPVVRLPSGQRLKHVDIMWAGFETQDEDLAKRIHAEADKADKSKGLPQRRELSDAGHYVTQFTGENVLRTIGVYSDSMAFGRADEEGRAETIRVMQAYLPEPSVNVIAV